MCTSWYALKHIVPRTSCLYESIQTCSRGVKKAKFSFEKKLAENIKKDSKSFFAYVRGRFRVTRKLGPVTDNGGNLVESSEGMFIKDFGKVFTKERLKDIPEPNVQFQAREI